MKFFHANSYIIVQILNSKAKNVQKMNKNILSYLIAL
jgi:hypothetical protein